MQSLSMIWGVELPRRPIAIVLREPSLMVLGQQVVIAGSFNYTGPATKLNAENIFISGDREVTLKTFVAAQKKLTRYASDEIDRIIKVFGKAL